MITLDFPLIPVNLYGALYFTAFLVLFFAVKSFLIKKNLDPGLAYVFTIYAIAGTIVGARVFHIIFYEPLVYLSNPLKVLYLWEGGLSSHGGILGIAAAGYLFFKKYTKDSKLFFLELADKVSIPAVLVLAVGRIINFSNGQLFGLTADIPWCVKSLGSEFCRHPVQIYESIKNFIVFFVLVSVKSRVNKKGLIFISFLFLYSSLRIFTDLFREYETSLLGLGVGQYLNILTMVISGFFLVSLLYAGQHNEENYDNYNKK